MKLSFKKENPYLKLIQQYKLRELSFKSLTFEKVQKVTTDDKPVIVEVKYDGELAGIIYEDNHLYTLSLHGRVREDFPALDELRDKFKANNISSAVFLGELYAVGVNGEKLTQSDVMSILRKPSPEDEKRIKIAVFDCKIINNKKVEDDYVERLMLAQKIVGNKGLAHIAYWKHGGRSVVKEMWDKFILGPEGMEGLVIHVNDVIKIKPTHTIDLVVIAAKKGLEWNRERIGSLLVAFMDENNVFRSAGHVGTGWSDEEKHRVWQELYRTRIDEGDRYMWVIPTLVGEFGFERLSFRPVEAWTFSKNHYNEVQKLPGAVLIKPKFVKWRTDKKVNSKDLRLDQIPDWPEKEQDILKDKRTILSRLDLNVLVK